MPRALYCSYAMEDVVRILACKPDKIKGKGQDKMRN
jgi:hypothetical protein